MFSASSRGNFGPCQRANSSSRQEMVAFTISDVVLSENKGSSVTRWIKRPNWNKRVKVRLCCASNSHFRVGPSRAELGIGRARPSLARHDSLIIRFRMNDHRSHS